MAEEGFYSFEEALTELHLKEEELKRLVSEGEIRAFRQGDTMRLRRADVHNLRNELSGGEVVDLGGVGEDLVFEDDADLETGMATEEISDADTILEEDVEDIGELDLDDDDDIAPTRVAAPGAAAGATAASVRRARTSPAAGRAEADEEEPAWAKAILIVTSIVLVLAIPVVMSVATGTASELAKGIAGMLGGEFSGG